MPYCGLIDTIMPPRPSSRKQPAVPAANPPLPALAALTHRLSARNTQKTLALFSSGCYNAMAVGAWLSW